MESRKVQKVGASTLSVSLPKEWAEKHGLHKGDILLIDAERDGSLRLIPGALHDSEAKGVNIEYLINADLCDEPGMLGRVVVGNYVIGRNALRIRSKSRIKSEHINEVRNAVPKLMGLGIMMETPDEIELQCSIDAARFPIETVIKRLYTIGATMQKEAIESLERGDARLAMDAIGREDEADKMYWLALRLLLSAQTDRALAEKIGIHEELPIVGNRLVAKNLEHVADYACNIAENVVKLLAQGEKVSPAAIKKVRKAGDLSAQIVQDALSCIFTHDIHVGNRAIEAKRKVEDIEEDLLASVVADQTDAVVVASLRAIAWSVRRIAEYGSEIAHIGINRYLERPSAVCKPMTGEPELVRKRR